MHRFRIRSSLAIVALVLIAAGLGGACVALHHAPVITHSDSSQRAAATFKPVAKLPNPAAVAAQIAQAAAVAHCAQNGPNKLLLVSISRQHIWACDGTTLTKDSAVTTGAAALTNVDDATPTGTFHIYSKQANRHLTGCDVNGCWNDPVAYWMPFDDQVGFHDASWQTFPYGSDLYKTEGSHGCVHLPLNFIAWLYTWAPVGTTVTVEA